MSREIKNHLVILCDRCGEEIAQVQQAEDARMGTGYPGPELTQAEVWFSPPGNRGGIRWQDDNGDWNDTRTHIYDSCNKCAAGAMNLISAYYERMDQMETNDFTY